MISHAFDSEHGQNEEGILKSIGYINDPIVLSRVAYNVKFG